MTNYIHFMDFVMKGGELYAGVRLRNKKEINTDLNGIEKPEENLFRPFLKFLVFGHVHFVFHVLPLKLWPCPVPSAFASGHF